MAKAWWEQPYKGGPLVPLPGFPRPLYPPDSGKDSVDGPDVMAYKRTISRAGRWPWDPPSWDDSFSNSFSHGKKGGNVSDSGVAGVQRQGKIDDSGWVGEKTFNLLRSIRVPAGLPHENEMAMDAKAQSLLVEAWEEFGGKEPDPPTQQSLRFLALQKAVSQLGVKESPPNSNEVKYCDYYGMVGPWCAMFCTWVYEQAGGSPSFQAGVSYAYVPYIVNDARAKRNGLSVTSSPQPGDLVCFDWEGDGCHDHVGLFEGWDGDGAFSAIEGNTSLSNDSNGGEVMRRSRSTGGTVFVRVAE